MLRAPDPSKDYILHTDASNVAMSGVAQQYDENNYLHPVAYWSKTFNPAQRNYSTTDRECLALVSALEHFETLLEGHKYAVEPTADDAIIIASEGINAECVIMLV